MATQLYDVIPGRPFGRGTETVTLNSNPNVFTNCAITAGQTNLTTTDNFAANGDILVLHQSYGVSSLSEENWHLCKVVSGGGTTSMVVSPAPSRTFNAGAQCTVLKEYFDVTVSSGWGGKGYGATVASATRNARGGIIAIAVSNKLTLNAVVHQNGYQGWISSSDRGGINEWEHFKRWWDLGVSGGHVGGCTTTDGGQSGRGGQSYNGYDGSESRDALWNGGGGATQDGCGSGGGNATSGVSANAYEGNGGYGGAAAGSADLKSIHFGGGGGGTAGSSAGGGVWTGSSGGGIIMIWAKEIVMGGSGGLQCISGIAYANNGHGGGTGAGGSILINTERATLGTSQINTGSGTLWSPHGGVGSNGRLRINYGISYSGTFANTSSSAAVDTKLIDSSGAMFFGYY